ncbi:MAG: oligosaccharide flippase family protein [Rhodanobacter sp.]|jgi:PST family polysaccharide transporter
MSTTGGFKTNVLSLYAVQGIQYLSPLLVLPILVRQLGSDQFGQLAFWQSLVGGLAILVDYGFNYSAVRALSKSDLTPVQIGKIYYATMSARFLLLIPATLLLFAISNLLPEHKDITLRWLGLIMLVGVGLSPAWYLAGMKRNMPLAYASAASLVIVTILTWIFVRGQNGLYIAAAIQFMAPVLTAAFAHWFVAKHVKPLYSKIHAKDVIETLREGAPLFLTCASSGLYSSLNPFLLGLVAASPQVAFFSLAERLIRSGRGLLNPLMAAIFPYSASQADSQKNRSILLTSSKILLLASTLLTLGLFISAPWAIPLLFGIGYGTSRIVVQILAINIIFVTVSNLLGVQNLIAKGRDKHVTIITTFAAPIHIASILIAGRMFGAIGAASAYVVTEAAVTVAIGVTAYNLRVRA